MRWWLCLALFCACDEIHGLDPAHVPLARVAFAVTGDPTALGIADDVPLYATLIWQMRASSDSFCSAYRDDPDPVRQQIIALGCPERDFAPIEVASQVLVPREALDGRTLWLPVDRMPRIASRSAVAAVVVYAERFGSPALELFTARDPYAAIASRDVVLAASTVPNDRYEVIALRDRSGSARPTDCATFMSLSGDLRRADGVWFGFSRVSVDKAPDGLRCETARLTPDPIRLGLARSNALTLARCYSEAEGTRFPSQASPPDLDAPWTCLGPTHLVWIDDSDADCNAITHFATSGCYDANDPCQVPEFTIETPTWWPCSGAIGGAQ